MKNSFNVDLRANKLSKLKGGSSMFQSAVRQALLLAKRSLIFSVTLCLPYSLIKLMAYVFQSNK